MGNTAIFRIAANDHPPERIPVRTGSYWGIRAGIMLIFILKRKAKRIQIRKKSFHHKKHEKVDGNSER